MLNGALSIRYLNIEYLLNAHDTLVMDSSELHAYKGSDGTATKAIVVIVSPQA